MPTVSVPSVARTLNASACLIALGAVLAAQQSSNFTGGKVSSVTDNAKPGIAHFHFDPGARTKWHSHEGGQIILVEEGVGLTQVKGGPVIELHAGDTIYAPPGVVHWHGASATQGGTQFNIARGMTTWGDEVTETEYAAKPQRK